MYDIISDVHGCLHELNELLVKLGYEWDNEVGVYAPPAGRQAVFVGDIVDRGPSSVTAYLVVRSMIRKGYAQAVRGNHDDKFMRWAMGRNVVASHGLEKTIEQAERMGLDKDQIAKFIEDMPFFLVLDGGKLAVVHAAWKDSFLDQDPHSKKHRAYCLYGPTTGEFNEHDLPVRIDWAAQRRPRETDPVVVYGHQPYREVRTENKTHGIDTGCVFGGSMTALRYPEMELVRVPAAREYESLEGRFAPPIAR